MAAIFAVWHTKAVALSPSLRRFKGQAILKYKTWVVCSGTYLNLDISSDFIFFNVYGVCFWMYLRLKTSLLIILGLSWEILRKSDGLIQKCLVQKLCWLRGSTTGPGSCPMSCKCFIFKRMFQIPHPTLVSASILTNYVYDYYEIIIIMTD